MKCYYAIFTKTTEAIEVKFPDLLGCVTFGPDWDHAFNNAIDVLAAWLAAAEPQFIKPPSTHKELENLEGILVPIPLDENRLVSYQKLIRINVIFPSNVLKKIDLYRKKLGLKRSTFLQIASEEYLERHGEAN